jgi:release factor glutamine methyltransferase
MNTNQRCWLTYEKNWLLKHDFSISNLKQYGDKPVEYITGYAPFYGREFKVSQSVLIPRPETEELIDLSIQTIESSKLSKKCLNLVEVGTGSGVIAITLILELQKRGYCSNVIAADISQQALDIARQNAQYWLKLETEDHFTLGKSKLKLMKSDLLDNYSLDQSPDLIIANLPYIPSEYMKQLPASVSQFEPDIALDGGRDGLKYIRRLVRQAQRIFDPVPLMLFEVDARAKITTSKLDLKPEQFKIVKDTQENQRFLMIDFSAKLT